MGRTHRPFYRICAIDSRSPRDGRALEELGTYDTSISEVDARVSLNTERIDYWLGVGAQPSDRVAVLIKKYREGGTHVDAATAAKERVEQAKRKKIRRGGEIFVPPAAPAPEPEPVVEAAPPEEPAAEEAAVVEETAAAEAPAEDAPAAEAAAEETTEAGTADAAAEEKPAE